MIEIHDSAQQYFRHLLEQQADGLGIQVMVLHPGTPAATCELGFVELDSIPSDDVVVPLSGLNLYLDAASAPYLDDAEIEFDDNSTGGQLIVRAPNIRGGEPGTDAPLKERVQYVLDAEINPAVADHGGRVSLVEVEASGVVVLQFGGGCHGCGMVDVTLKQGIEKTLKERIPEVTAVHDVTDHTQGENPYYA